jgi:AraC-like DNA-binding protein
MAYKLDVCLSTVDGYLERCFLSEDPPRVSELASLLGVSRESLSRRFAEAAGISLTEYIKERQLAYAKALLTTSQLTTQRIAYRSGFGTRRTFYRAFRRATGISPAHYRRSHNVSRHPSGADE